MYTSIYYLFSIWDIYFLITTIIISIVCDVETFEHDGSSTVVKKTRKFFQQRKSLLLLIVNKGT